MMGGVMTEESAHWLEYLGGDGGFRSDIDDGDDVPDVDQGDELHREDRYWLDVARLCDACKQPVTLADERRGRCPHCGAFLLSLGG